MNARACERDQLGLIMDSVNFISLSLGECNTILSAYTLYRHLG